MAPRSGSCQSVFVGAAVNRSVFLLINPDHMTD
jgi:hypothetical protein